MMRLRQVLTFAAALAALGGQARAQVPEAPEPQPPEATEPEPPEADGTEPQPPEATEPEATEPEATEPAATEPNATQPSSAPEVNSHPPNRATEPPLPEGLDADREPALPEGLESDPPLPEGLEPEPTLPAGLEGSGAPDAASAESSTQGLPLEWQLAADLRVGTRVVSDPYQRTLSLAEFRVQLDASQSWRLWSSTARLVVDGVLDPLSEEQVPRLEKGQGAVDLRTSSLTLSPSEFLDVRLGRQIITWGTGDLLFINDLFPKDWLAFLIGRDEEYLKAPSDALKLSLFSPWVGLDVVLTPRFDADRLPLRERLSSWEPSLGRIAGEAQPIVTDQPDDWISDGELALRLHQQVASWEWALYGYRGFHKSPAGVDSNTGAASFPALSVYGASIRGPVLGGILSSEVGLYDSLDDRAGNDPLVRNGETRLLFGYERELSQGLTLGAQYYLEHMLDYARYRATLPGDSPAAHAWRDVLTLRLEWLALEQRLRFSVFAFASPADKDGYLRPLASYAFSDRWRGSAGLNLFAGSDHHSFFGQFRYNSNAYLALSYAR